MNQPSKLTRARANEIASLDRASKRRELGQFRIEGWRAVESAIRARADLREVVLRHDLLDDRGAELVQRARAVRNAPFEVRGVSARTSSKLSDVVQDQGIIAVAEIPEPDPGWMTEASRVVALDGVQDPGNVGTIVRCAAWFGFDAVLAGPGTADFYNPKTVRSTAGAMWDLDLVPSENLADELVLLKDAGFEIVGADLSGRPLANWQPGERTALVLGSEAHGLSEEAAGPVDTFLRIKGGAGVNAGVESLNVAIAAAVIMHHIAQ